MSLFWTWRFQIYLPRSVISHTPSQQTVLNSPLFNDHSKFPLSNYFQCCNSIPTQMFLQYYTHEKFHSDSISITAAIYLTEEFIQPQLWCRSWGNFYCFDIRVFRVLWPSLLPVIFPTWKLKLYNYLPSTLPFALVWLDSLELDWSGNGIGMPMPLTFQTSIIILFCGGIQTEVKFTCTIYFS